MKSRTINIILILLIVLIMFGYVSIRSIVYSDNNFINLVNETQNDIKTENWSDAIINSKKIDEEWRRIRSIVTLNFAESNIDSIEENISQLISGTENHDAASALSSVIYLVNAWQNINKLTPQP